MAPIFAHSISLPPVHTPAQGAAALDAFSNAELDDALAGARERNATFLRVVQGIDTLTPVPWLRERARDVRASTQGLFHWSSRDDAVQIAGIGLAASGNRIDAFDGTNEADRMTPLEAVRRLVTLRFDPYAPIAEEWSSFGLAAWYVPAIEVLTCSGASAIAVQVALPTDSAARDMRNRLRLATTSLTQDVRDDSSELPPFEVESESCGTAFWTRHIKAILASIADGMIAKGVLARRSCWRATSPCSAADVLAVLHRAHPDTYRFLIQPPSVTGQPSAFFGASPEQLFARSGQDIVTESLAGTRARGADDAGDSRLESELRSNRKETYEHSVVTEQLKSQLANLCVAPPIEDAVRVRKLRHVQHLCTPLRGTLRAGATDHDVIRVLHPTPAVCGSPVPAAFKLIRSLEGFDRGLYAGPVGCITADSSEFAVAIRSGRMEENRITLYAGAGIVEGSTAEHEWQETENKLRTVEDLLRAEPTR